MKTSKTAKDALTFFAVVAAMIAACLITVSCAEEHEGPAEKLGEKIDDAADDAGDAVEDAADELEDAADDADLN
ncbi:MAG: hypothetical protein R3F11_04275 [Verrucomicrobiales bacterium]